MMGCPIGDGYAVARGGFPWSLRPWGCLPERRGKRKAHEVGGVMRERMLLSPEGGSLNKVAIASEGALMI
jgi:hypothetical protein